MFWGYCRVLWMCLGVFLGLASIGIGRFSILFVLFIVDYNISNDGYVFFISIFWLE